MATSSILGGERAPSHPDGRGANRLGPSDSSDSGSDALGELSSEALESDSDRYGTGDRASVNPRDSAMAADVRPDHIERESADALDAASVSIEDGGAEVSELAVDEDDEASEDE